MNKLASLALCIFAGASAVGCAEGNTSGASGSQTLSSPSSIQDVYEFDPPPDGATVTVTADQAAGSLEQADGIKDSAPILVVFTNTQQLNPQGDLLFDHVLAWDIQRSGCFPVPQISPPPGVSESSAPPEVLYARGLPGGCDNRIDGASHTDTLTEWRPRPSWWAARLRVPEPGHLSLSVLADLCRFHLGKCRPLLSGRLLRRGPLRGA